MAPALQIAGLWERTPATLRINIPRGLFNRQQVNAMLMCSPRFPAFPSKGRVKSRFPDAESDPVGALQTMAPGRPERRVRISGFFAPRRTSQGDFRPDQVAFRGAWSELRLDTAECTYREGTNHGPGEVALYKTHRRDTKEITPKGPTAWQFDPAGLSGKRTYARTQLEENAA